VISSIPFLQHAAGRLPFGKDSGQDHLPLEVTDGDEHLVTPLAQADIAAGDEGERDAEEITAVRQLLQILQHPAVEYLPGILTAETILRQLG
jgi:hypothetical protein